MYTFEAEKRDLGVKARKVRRNRLTPACLFGGQMEETMPLQISESEITKLLKEKDVGGLVGVKVDGKSYPALIKEIDRDLMNNTIVHVAFQSLKKGEAVNSTARVLTINLNEDKLMVYTLMEEIPYKAKAENLVEEIVVDLKDLEVPKTFAVKDLPIAKDENIELLVDEDIDVLNVVNKVAISDEEMDAMLSAAGIEEEQPEPEVIGEPEE